ncbi:MAG: HEAT repeat domain-containing protein, partial [Planctomycetaceae bacterium]
MTRAHAMWVLVRRGGLELADLRGLVSDRDRLVRVHAAKALAAVESTRFALARLELARELLTDADPFVQRAAAETLGQIPDAASAVPLLELWRKTATGDTHLIHVTRIALRNCLNGVESWGELVSRAVMVHPGHLARLADVSVGSPTAAAGRFLTRHLGQEGLDPNRMAEFAAHAGRHLPAEELSSLYQTIDRQLSPLNLQQQVGVVRGLAQALQLRQIVQPPFLQTRGSELAAQLLQGNSDDELRSGAELARDLRVVGAQPRLREVALDAARPTPLRQLTIEVLNSLNGEANSDILQQIIRRGTEAVPVRQKAAELLGGQGSQSSRIALLKLLPEVPDPVGVSIARALASG